MNKQFTKHKKGESTISRPHKEGAGKEGCSRKSVLSLLERNFLLFRRLNKNLLHTSQIYEADVVVLIQGFRLHVIRKECALLLNMERNDAVNKVNRNMILFSHRRETKNLKYIKQFGEIFEGYLTTKAKISGQQ